MNRLIRDVMHEVCAALKVTPALVKTLHHYAVGFTTKNAEHIEFFGEKLIGVHSVKFTRDDRGRWFHEIMGVDEAQLEAAIQTQTDINIEFAVSSDTMNLSAAWLLHVFYVDKSLKPADRQQAMVDILLILQYKYLTSLLYHYFKYPADPATAKAAYAALSGKFAIKTAESWGALLRAQAEEIVSDKGLHQAMMQEMANNDEVVYFLNNTQGRIRGMLKNYYEVFMRVHQSGVRIHSTSSIIEFDGEAILRDQSQKLIAYRRYALSILSDPTSFIRQELLTIIERLIHTAPPRLIHQSLSWMSEHHAGEAALVEEVINESLLHAFHYLNEEKAYVRAQPDLPALLGRLKGVYSSSRSTDPELIALRALVEKLIKHATGNQNPSILASVRTAVLLYIVARTLAMQHYAQAA